MMRVQCSFILKMDNNRELYCMIIAILRLVVQLIVIECDVLPAARQKHLEKHLEHLLKEFQVHLANEFQDHVRYM